MRNNAPKVNYEAVTDDLVRLLEQGTPPWVCEWNDPRSRFLPFNVVSMADNPNQTYRGMNVIMLWARQKIMGYSCNGWITLKALRELGGNLITMPDNAPRRADNKTGQKAQAVINAKPFVSKGYKQVADNAFRHKETGEIVGADTALIRIPRVAGYVFNLDQVENLPEEYTKPQDKPSGTQEEADRMLAAYGVEEKTSDDNRCAYSPSKDTVYMVHPKHFQTEDDWYRTRFHEFIHSTGHAIRLDRFQEAPTKEEYAFEELIAEMGSAFLCARFGIPGKVQHASYLQHYIKVLKDDPKAIFRAASEARKASELILSSIPETQAVIADAA
jgi:antirestriction protein ArdC